MNLQNSILERVSQSFHPKWYIFPDFPRTQFIIDRFPSVPIDPLQKSEIPQSKIQNPKSFHQKSLISLIYAGGLISQSPATNPHSPITSH
jgi:hypothetical protein